MNNVLTVNCSNDSDNKSMEEDGISFNVDNNCHYLNQMNTENEEENIIEEDNINNFFDLVTRFRLAYFPR